jgi:sugar/nucleoside kinase (ribokinase family)
MEPPKIIVAGHLCLDIIPAMTPSVGGLASLLAPGQLVDVGPATLCTGGPVSNTGLALHRLGVPVALMGKVGDDIFGQAVLDLVRRQGPDLAGGMIVARGEHTSYTLVISVPGIDRVFLHCPGANDTFGAADIRYDRLRGAKVFHFGYPPLMRRMFADGGSELASLLERVKREGLTTSLDMAMPDLASPAGKIDWPALLGRVLPHVDVFAPSYEEILFLIDRPAFERMLARRRDGGLLCDGRDLTRVSDRLLAMGAAVVLLKLGDQGLYLRTSDDAARLAVMGAGRPADGQAWRGREMLGPCFQVNVAGTTGSGDATIAGFLTALLEGMDPRRAVTSALAVGACNVEAPDALGGIIPWQKVQARIAASWPRRQMTLALDGWTKLPDTDLWAGSNDRKS